MVDMVSLFYRVFVSTTGLKSFSLRPEKFPERFSFGDGRVRFFLLCKAPFGHSGIHRGVRKHALS